MAAPKILLSFILSYAILVCRARESTSSNETLLRLLAEPCAYRGHKQKGAPLPMEMWIHFNDSAFRTWLYSYATGLTTLPEAGWPAPMSRRCNVFVNDAYRFIYVRTRKVGGSSFVNAHHSTRLCKNAKDPVTINGRADCLRPATPPDYEKWMNYTVIGHVRNPWARAASSYMYINTTWSRSTAWVRIWDGNGLKCWSRLSFTTAHTL